MSDPIRVVYLDADEERAARATDRLEQAESRLSVIAESDPSEALAHLPDAECVVSDHDAPALDGIAVLETVRESDPDLPFVLFTASGSEDVAADAVAAGATDYVQRGTDEPQFAALANSIATAVEQYRTGRDADEATARERAIPGIERDELLDRISEAFFALDTDWRITYLNGPAEAVVRQELDRAPDSLIGETFWDVVPDAEGRIFEDHYRRAMESQEPVTLEAESTVTGGWVEVRAYPSESGLSVFFRDVTERKERQQELQRKNERLEEFAGVISHDLRNPLQVGKAHADILDAQSDDADETHVEKIQESFERIDDIIDSLLTLAREGEAIADTSQVDLETVAKQAWGSVETGVATLTVDGTTAVEADPDRLQELFENLFRNSVEHGGEDLSVTVGTSADGFYVADDGPGIPESERDAVFTQGYTTSADGTGFGLAIVRAIAQGHDWSVSAVESEDGGARFEFRT